MGNNWQAIADFERAIAIDAEYSPAYFYLGVSKLHDRKPKDAQQHFEKALSLDVLRENTAIYDGLAQCYHKQGKYQEAIEEFKNAIRAEKEKGNDHPV